VTGPDDNIWFTQSAANQVGQVVLPESVETDGSSFNATAGTPVTGGFAAFKDKSSLVDLPRFFSPSIAFGDGTTGTGTLQDIGNQIYDLYATHTYQATGTYHGSALVAGAVGPTAPVAVVATVAPATVVTNPFRVGSLRQAIQAANAQGGHPIEFAIPVQGVATITLQSPLPTVQYPTFIDGRSQDSFEGVPLGAPLIQLDGQLVGGSAAGLDFAGNSNGSGVDCLAIYGFAGPQLEFDSPNDFARGDYLGLQSDGFVPAPLSSNNGSTATASAVSTTPSDGLLILAPGAIVGGPDLANLNVITGNTGEGIELSGPSASNVTIENDIIGLDPTGTVAWGNAINGILVAGGSNETIGPGVVVSANKGDGIALIASHRDAIQGVTIGTDPTGERAFGNAGHGVFIDQASSDINIGAAAGGAQGNVISGNGNVGVVVQAGSTGVNVAGDLIGTDRAGEKGIGNGIAGVLILDASANVVGPNDIISGNGVVAQGAGVWIDGPDSTRNAVIGDKVGTDQTSESALGNSVIGVLINLGTANTIGGTATGDSDVISGNTVVGVMIAGPSAGFNVVNGDLIGTDQLGQKAVPNGSNGQGDGLYIDDSPNNLIGGPLPGMGNVISGNVFDGVQVFGPGSSGNIFQANRIGTNLNGTARLGNGDDGLLVNGAPGTRIVGNVISANTFDGITVSGPGSTDTLIMGNAIGQGSNGQPLGNGAFGLLLINGAPEPTLVANANTDNILGPIRDTSLAPAAATVAPASTPKTKVKAASKKVQPKQASFGSRALMTHQLKVKAKAKTKHS
jgi:hypothetical protein